MIPVEYKAAIEVWANGLLVKFKPCQFNGKVRFMAFLPDDFDVSGQFRTPGYTVHHERVDRAAPEKLATGRLAPHAAYTLPEPLVHALLQGWHFEDLWGAGKGDKWDEEGGRGANHLTILESALTPPPIAWLPGCRLLPWEMDGWKAPSQTWRAPEPDPEPVEDLDPLAAFEAAPGDVDPILYEKAKEEGQVKDIPPEEQTPIVPATRPETWTEEEWQKMIAATKELHKPDEPAPVRGRLEWIWKNKVTPDKRRKMPALSDDELSLLVRLATA